MKLAIVFADYLPAHQSKDPGLITQALGELGMHAAMVTESKVALHEEYIASAPFKIFQSAPGGLADVCIREHFDTVIFYHGFSRRFSRDLAIFSTSKLPFIIKADSDGMISPIPFYSELWKKEILLKRSLLGLLKVFAKKITYSEQKSVLRRVLLANATIIESSKAKENLVKTLMLLNHKAHMLTEDEFARMVSKLIIIPNPVAQIYSEVESCRELREPMITAIGRWDDPAKGSEKLMNALRKVMSTNQKYSVQIIGPGDSIIHRYSRMWPMRYRSRLEIVGPAKPSEVRKRLLKSQILVSASNWEGFPISAGEALCSGNSLAAPPLPAFLDLVGERSQFGSIATENSAKYLAQAILKEITCWNDGWRRPTDISGYWAKRLRPTTIARSIIDVIRSMLSS